LDTIDGRTLIFVATKKSADILDRFLGQEGYSTASIHGDRTQFERENALEAFKTGRARILVATDVAARGLHIDDVAHVINYDLPSNIEDYVHRIGRTGRCGKMGIATGFFNDNNSNIVKELIILLRESSQEIPEWLYEYGKDNSFSRKKGGYSNNGRRGYNSYNNNQSFGNRGHTGFSNSFSGYNNYSKDDNTDKSERKPYSFNRSGDQWNEED